MSVADDFRQERRRRSGASARHHKVGIAPLRSARSCDTGTPRGRSAGPATQRKDAISRESHGETAPNSINLPLEILLEGAHHAQIRSPTVAHASVRPRCAQPGAAVPLPSSNFQEQRHGAGGTASPPAAWRRRGAAAPSRTPAPTTKRPVRADCVPKRDQSRPLEQGYPVRRRTEIAENRHVPPRRSIRHQPPDNPVKVQVLSSA